MMSTADNSSNSKRVANAVGGKTARACDSCIKKRARWYCAADDAFLCQSCDSSVHSANPLARRHERVRLKMASFKSLVTKETTSNKDNNVPSWPQRKARTPRHWKSHDKRQYQLVRSSTTSSLRVPEVSSDDQASNEEIEQQLLYRVPIYDPFVAELCNSSANINSFDDDSNNCVVSSGVRVEDSDRDGKGQGQGVLLPLYGKEVGEEEEGFREFLATEMDLAEFAADVESLLGRGVDEESTFGVEELGLVTGCNKEDNYEAARFLEENRYGMVKEEEMNTLELGFDYYICCGGGEEEEVVEWNKGSLGIGDNKEMKGEVGVDKKKRDKKRKEVLLRLDYEAVMNAWGSQGGSPWTTGSRPDYDPDECWPDCLCTSGTELQQPYGEHINGLGGGGGHPAILGDGGREARVSRYKEKRRTRLFSKKIRYEVRKLNAEKRPRMKGRFVKRANFSETAFSLLNK